MNKIPIDRLKSLLSYDPETGDIRWKESAGRKPAGSLAGSRHSHGYLTISVDKVKILAHRVAWAIHYGEWPAKMLDHRDLDKMNNRIVNLREASGSQNAANTRHLGSSTGLRGVFFFRNRYIVRMKIRGKQRHIGCFLTEDEAKEVRDLAADLMYGEFARY